MSLINITGTYTDLYQLTMGQVYFWKGRHKDTAVFDYFFRKLPFNGGFAVFAGLSELLTILQDLRFSDEDLAYLEENGFDNQYLKYLKAFRFQGDIYSAPEGDVIFPARPVLRVEGGLLEAQLIETLLLNLLNFQSLIATKAARMRLVAGDRILSEFGLRRAQALGGYHATKAALAGGFNSTSNVLGAEAWHLQANGTMAHAFIQGYDDELTAFRDYAEVHPDQCVLLVDTYDTLESGLPNAIQIAKELEGAGYRLKGIRLDSGDLAYLSKRARHMLDEAGLQYVKIVASNQLDEYVIRSLSQQNAPIDIFGVGTSLVTGAPDGALDGVYKLAFSGGSPRIKLSETIKKITLPDRKQVFRMEDEAGNFFGAEAVALNHEEYVTEIIDPFEPHKSLDISACRQKPLLQKVMAQGNIIHEPLKIGDIASFCKAQLKKLPEEYKRFDNPHIYKVGVSRGLYDLRDSLIKSHRE